jgi:hypothetical protein
VALEHSGDPKVAAQDHGEMGKLGLAACGFAAAWSRLKN